MVNWGFDRIKINNNKILLKFIVKILRINKIDINEITKKRYALSNKK